MTPRRAGPAAYCVVRYGGAWMARIWTESGVVVECVAATSRGAAQLADEFIERMAARRAS